MTTPHPKEDREKKIADDLIYFHTNRSLARYTLLEEAKELLPDFKLVYENYLSAKMALDAYINSIKS